MKKNILTITILLLSIISFSQTDLNLGLNLGGTYSNVSGNEIANKNKYDFDLIVGINLEYPLSENISLIGNINYEKKSFKNTLGYIDPNDISFSGTADLKVTLEYLSIPIMIKYYFGENKNIYFNGGPYISFLLDDYTKIENNKVEDEESLIKNTDFGLSFGVGTKIRINENNDLNIEIRDNFGLSNISSAPTINDKTVKINSINLLLNWSFDL